MNEIILQETQIEEAPRYSEAVVRRAPVMAKWLWVLFWVLIASNVLSLLCMIPALGKLEPYVQFLAYVAYFVALMKLNHVDSRYGKAAGFCLAGAVLLLLNSLRLTYATTFYEGNVEFFSLTSSAFLLISCYYEYHAHKDIVGEVDAELGQRWIKVWHWKIAALGIGIASVLLVFISVVFVAIILVLVALFAIVVGIIVIVALYRSTKAYRAVAAFVEKEDAT